MTIPMLPIGGQISSLLRSAKRQAGLLEDEEDPTVGAPPAALPFGQMPQQMQAPQMQGGQMPASDAHAHKEGLLGRLGHAFGGDRIQPEVAALLTPDQQSRVRRGAGGALWDYLARGETTSEAQQRRAGEMLTLGDTKQAREAKARQESQWAQIQSVAEKIPDPQTRLEYVARMAASMGLAQGDTASAAVPRTRPEAVKILGPQSIAIDPTTGETMAESPADVEDVRDYLGGKAKFKNGVFASWVIRPVSERDTTTGDALSAQREYQRVQGLRDDYANNPTIKRAADYASAFQGIQAAAVSDDPQSNLAMMYEAVKMRDPNAVREGELALQRGARGVPQWLYAYWDKASKGNVLTATERQQIVAWARQKIVEQNRLVLPIQREFGGAARRFGVQADSSFIAPSPFRGTGVVAEGKTMTQAEFNRLSPAAQQAARAGGYTITP